MCAIMFASKIWSKMAHKIFCLKISVGPPPVALTNQLFIPGEWLYVVVVVVILFTIGIAVAVFCYIKRHNQVKNIIKTQYNPLYPLM